MILDATTKTIEVVLEGAITTNQLDVTAGYADSFPGGGFVPGEQDTSTNGATPVTAVSAPPANVQRMVNEIRVYNKDTVTHTVTIQLNNNGTRRVLQSEPCAPGAVVVYAPSGGTLTDRAPLDFVELESGSTPVKISAMTAFNLALPPTGAEVLPIVEGSANQKITLEQLYTLFANWLNYIAANPLNGASPGAVFIQAGTASGGSGSDGGSADIEGGVGDGAGAGGDAILAAGTGGASAGAGGAVNVNAGNDGGSGGGGGNLVFGAGQGTSSDNGGGVFVVGGTAAGSGTGGEVRFTSGPSISGNTGSILLKISNAASGDSGNLTLQLGTASGTQGNLIIVNLPTSSAGLPSDAIWCDTGAGNVLKRV